MKTKLFYLFIAVFLFSVSGKSQTCPPNWPYAHCISLIGPGVSSWDTDVYLTSADGNVFTLGDVLIKETTPGSGIGGDIKFRRDGCWDSCAGNPAGYSSATGTGFPTGSGESVPFGPNIKPTPGVWNVTFTLSTKSWSFTPGTPVPTVKIFGTATTPVTGVSMSATTKTTFEIKKLALKAGNAQFEINTTPGGAPTLAVLGGLTFPNGIAEDETKFIPVSATNDYDVTLDLTSGAYTFKVATFPSIALVGAAAGGWPTGAVGEIDDQVMTTTDGITYTLKNIPMIPGGCVFRGGNAWAIKYGNTPFPTGTNDGGKDIIVPAGMAGNYNVTLNATTGVYAFTLNTYALVGAAAGGWPTGAVGEVDDQVMTTTDGVTYTLNNVPMIPGGCVFRGNNAWDVKYGNTPFPIGTNDGGKDIIVPAGMAGTYNVTLNVLTGAYNFGTALAVTKFDTVSFKAYPNPTSDSWNIVSGNDDITSIQVYDVLGKAVYAKSGASKEVTINASELSSGIYYAKIATANGESTLKLVKE